MKCIKSFYFGAFCAVSVFLIFQFLCSKSITTISFFSILLTLYFPVACDIPIINDVSVKCNSYIVFISFLIYRVRVDRTETIRCIKSCRLNDVNCVLDPIHTVSYTVISLPTFREFNTPEGKGTLTCILLFF